MATVQRSGLVGRTVDERYRVLTHIADGGMGSVYAALDTRLERQVALKVMRDDLARDEEFVARFRREARSAAGLSHPHVVTVYDQGEDEGLCFLAMEFIDGQTLRERLTERSVFTPREALDVTVAVLEALRAAHRRDIIHRDIKPENVLLSTDDVVKVADFGLARAVTATTATGRTGPLLGTVAYLAPEQVEHGRADHRSDLYCVGLLLHEMLTGRPAVEGDSPIHVAWQHVNGTLATPSSQVPELPKELDDLVAAATAADPDERFEDATAFLAALRTTRMGLSDEVLDHRPEREPATTVAEEDQTHHTSTLARQTRSLPRLGATALGAPDAPETTVAEPETPRRRRRVPLLLAVLLVLALAGGGSAYWWFGPPGERTVPELVAIERTAAEQALLEEDLVPTLETEFSETVPADTVIRAGAEAGAVVRRGTQVSLVVSQGPERYDVPDVSGQTVDEATTAIESANLSVGATREEYDETVPEGHVVSTAPAIGTSSRPGTAVSLLVSRGPRPVPIDDIVGTPLADAQSTLEEAGLTVTVAPDRVYSQSVPEGSVVATDPGEGPLYSGDEITLTVSRGPEMVEIPPVRTLSENQAIAALEDAGFEVKVERILGGLYGTAHTTIPGTGESAPKGSTVTLRVV
ncbi:MAG: Stk1 family PASTA domain-containing Ser/Thr kinase [Mobilicoccus sp.]|nr:Stk1 family PASTA domain-containing Ser/Thr kinase [Mobilicoccus sp.]